MSLIVLGLDHSSDDGIYGLELSPTLRYIQELLEANGIPDFVVLPKKHIQGENLKESYLTALNEVFEIIATEAVKREVTVLGISTTTWTYEGIMGIVAGFKETLREVEKQAGLEISIPIALGGPHFRPGNLDNTVRECFNFRPGNLDNTVRECFNHREGHNADVVVRGNFQALIDFYKAFKDGVYKFEDGHFKLNQSPPPGVFVRADGGIVGAGKSLPDKQLQSMPFIVQPFFDNYMISGIFDNRCPNSCDFCSKNQSQLRFSLEQLYNGIVKLGVNPNLVKSVNFLDANPFGDINVQRTTEYVRNLRSIFGEEVQFEFFVDPACLISQRDVIYQLAPYTLQVYIGRDAVTEENARAIGTRRGNTIRDQAALDQERRAIIEYVEELKRTRNGNIRWIDISYIVSPLETREGWNIMLDESREFAAMGDENGFNLLVQHCPLVPHPQTLVRHRMRRYLKHPIIYSSDAEKVWDFSKLPKDSVFPRIVEMLNKSAEQKS